MKKLFTLLGFCGLWMSIAAQDNVQQDYSVHQSVREDGREQSTYAIVHQMLKQTTPRCAYQEGMSPENFKAWQERVSDAMAMLMNFPQVPEQPAPQRVSVEPREGYTLEKWEFYPFPNAVSTFLVLKPDGLKQATPAVLCIPGSGRTKEGLAGEPGVDVRFNEKYTDPKVCMALDMVKAGYVAVAVDNAAAGESSDLERYKQGSNYDYDVVSRFLAGNGMALVGIHLLFRYAGLAVDETAALYS